MPDQPPYPYGTLVSLSRTQTTLVDVLHAAEIGERFALTLGGRLHGIDPEPGTTATQIAIDLAALIQNAQTVFSVAAAGPQLAIVGPLGEDFEVVTTGNLRATTTVAAVRAIHPDGTTIGPIRVTIAENTMGQPMRHFWTTLFPSHHVVEVWRFFGREVGTERVLDINAADVLTVLSE